MSLSLNELLKEMPIVAILRGITTSEILDVAEILHTSGIKIIEVPLNSPNPYETIKLLSSHFGDSCLCGAGTVTTEQQVEQVLQAGGKLIVSPNTNAKVIARTIECGMVSIPGFSTPTEAFTAIEAGATALKLFPASTIGTESLKALLTVLPKEVAVIATGGINADNLEHWISSGSAGAGIGGDLYRPGVSLQNLATQTQQLTDANQRIKLLR